MSLRTKIILFNTCVLAAAFLAAAVALGGFSASLNPLRQAIEAEARAVERGEALLGRVAETARLTPSQSDDEAVTVIQQLAESERAMRAAERSAAETAVTTTAVFLGLIALGITACAVLSLSYSRHILRRVLALAGGTRRVAQGDRKVQLPAPPAGDELDQLTHAFNGMVRQLAEAEESAREAEALKAGFLASVSHDLRTPLTTIRGLLETLGREEAAWDPAMRREFLDVALRETDRLTRLVTNLLDLTRLDAGAWPLEIERLDLHSIAQGLLADLQLPGGVLAQHRVSLTLSTAGSDGAGVAQGGTLTACGDELQVRRVIENLLTNAAKFAPHGSEIRVEIGAASQVDPQLAPHSAGNARTLSAVQADVVEIAVEDEGPGVTPAEAGLVFERFYRARPRAGERGSAVPEVKGGTGLGLAIARGLVEAQGGKIWVEPARRGSGARFVFTLPSADAAPADARMGDGTMNGTAAPRTDAQKEVALA
jgi:signal transduction histidine kinase